MDTCPECGAPETVCDARYNECLALEFSDLDYGAVHHLTVATYMLQHSSKLTCTGWLEMRQLLHEFLVENKAPAAIRQQNKDKVDSGKRQFKIKSKTGERIIAKSSWKKTICDVSTEDGERYCADITEWARAVLAESWDLLCGERMNTYYEPVFFRILRFCVYTFICACMFGIGLLMKGYWFAFFVVIYWFFYVVRYNYLGGQSITIAPNGMFYYIKPFQKIQVGWDGFQKTGKFLFREGLFIKESYLIAKGKALYITFIPLSIFAKNWRDSDLGQQIKQYAPHLFEKEKSVQSAEEEF